jgi:hypothetical protein
LKPELLGHVFVGRTKEGFSLNKVMVGYAGWTMEAGRTSFRAVSRCNSDALAGVGDGNA